MKISNDTDILDRVRPYDVEYLYKYRQVDSQGLDRIFTHSEIYLPDPTKFNDPFDCKPQLTIHKGKYKRNEYYKSIVKNRFPYASNQEINHEVKHNPRIKLLHRKENLDKLFIKFIKSFGIYCLAEVPDDILMWSHYSSSHEGICLQFKANKEPSIIWEAFKVTYQHNYPEINTMEMGDTTQFFNLVATKSSHWKYEKERRVIKTEEEGGSKIYTFEPELLTGVILGAKISNDDEKQVLSWIENSSSNINVYRAKLNSKKYGLNIKGINC